MARRAKTAKRAVPAKPVAPKPPELGPLPFWEYRSTVEEDAIGVLIFLKADLKAIGFADDHALIAPIIKVLERAHNEASKPCETPGSIFSRLCNDRR